MTDKFARIKESGEYSDLTIVAGKVEFKVHRAIVCSQSGFFKVACKKSFVVRPFPGIHSMALWRIQHNMSLGFVHYRLLDHRIQIPKLTTWTSGRKNRHHRATRGGRIPDTSDDRIPLHHDVLS